MLCCYRLLIMAKPLIPSYFWYRWVHTVLINAVTQGYRLRFQSQDEPIALDAYFEFFFFCDLHGLFGSLVVIYLEQIIIYLFSYVTRFTMYG